MKRLFAIVLCVCMMLTVVACAKTNNNPTEAPTEAGTQAPTEAGTEAPTNPETPAVEAEYKLGMGVVVSTAESKSGTAQVDATVAAVVTDKDGKIVMCRIDVAQNKFDLTAEDFAAEAGKTFETKMQLGDRYGMAGNPYSSDNNGDGKILEWDAQTKEFEKFVVGKTGAEVAALELKEAEGHMIAVDETLLAAGCTIQIGDFMEAVKKACDDEQYMTFTTAETFTLGVAAMTTAAESVAATAEADGTIKMYTDYAASVVVGDKVIATLNDATQPNITVDIDGEIIGTDVKGTKRELKEEYGMAGNPYSSDNNGDGKILEWYVQSEAFSKYIVEKGMTAEQIANMETKQAEGHEVAADEALLTAGCTIQITAIKAVVAQSVTNAR